jgi:hypothetical protein
MIFSMLVNFQCNYSLNSNIDAFDSWKLHIVPTSLKGHCKLSLVFCELIAKLVNISQQISILYNRSGSNQMIKCQTTSKSAPLAHGIFLCMFEGI